MPEGMLQERHDQRAVLPRPLRRQVEQYLEQEKNLFNPARIV
jgi:hypothetical protein